MELSQELPWVYADEGFNGNRDMYVTSACCVRFRVRVVTKRNGSMIVSGPRWRAFALVNVNEDVQLLHFVEEGEDSYFVTGYNWDGTEFAGYNMIAGRFPRFRSNVSPYLDVCQVIIYFRLIFFLDCDLFIKWFIFWVNDYNLYGIYKRQRLPLEFLEGLGNEGEITVKGNGINFVVNVRRVRVGGVNGRRMYEIDMEDWIGVEENLELEPGMILIFTRKRANKILVTGFSVNGHLTTDAHFKGATRLLRIQPPLQPDERGLFNY